MIRQDMRSKRADWGMVGIDEVGKAYVNGSSAGFVGTGSLVRGRNNKDEADLGKREGRMGRDWTRGERCGFTGGCKRAEVLVRLRGGGWCSAVGEPDSEESWALVDMLVRSGAEDRRRACFRGDFPEWLGKGTPSTTFQAGNSSENATRAAGGSRSTSIASVSSWLLATLLEAEAVARERAQWGRARWDAKMGNDE